VEDAGRRTVLIADTHEHYRSGLVRAIAMHPGLELGGVTDDGFAALSLIISQRPDLALLDVRLPGLDGFAITRRLMAGEPPPRTRVVLLSAVLDHAQRARARTVGAVGCLGKDASRWEICSALIAVARGEHPALQEPDHGLAQSSMTCRTAAGRLSDADARAR